MKEKGEKKLVSVDNEALFHIRKNERKGCGIKGKQKRKHQADKGNTPCAGAMSTVKQHQWHRSLLRAFLTFHTCSWQLCFFALSSIAVTAVTQQLQ